MYTVGPGFWGGEVSTGFAEVRSYEISWRSEKGIGSSGEGKGFDVSGAGGENRVGLFPVFRCRGRRGGGVEELFFRWSVQM